MSKFQEFLDAILTGAVDLATTTFGDVPEAALADAKEFIAFAKTNLEEMTADLANGDISLDEFEELAMDLKHLAKFVALSDLGILKTRLERFRTGLIDLIVGTAKTMFLPG